MAVEGESFGVKFDYDHLSLYHSYYQHVISELPDSLCVLDDASISQSNPR
jgi:hypothetical protein